ncbi:hypothetical protein J6590_045047 [Homalodisca vitripennis]|nr:hypothetical protein J6590_045047 [Homalodisca vitripennis]
MPQALRFKCYRSDKSVEIGKTLVISVPTHWDTILLTSCSTDSDSPETEMLGHGSTTGNVAGFIMDMQSRAQYKGLADPVAYASALAKACIIM